MRSVTQGDVYRAEAKDVPRIFQVSRMFNILAFEHCDLGFFTHVRMDHTILYNKFLRGQI